jgi:multisubunit Na+/H+ antiporter MnhF subunit
MIANFILIPKMGYLAACWATLLSDFAHYWMCMELLKRSGFPIHTVKLMGIPVLGSALFGLCLLLSQLFSSIFYIIPFIVLAFIVYIGIIFLCKYISKEEIFSLINPKDGVKQEEILSC